MYNRIDRQQTPNVDLMLSVLAETSQGIRATSATYAAAVRATLACFGVEAQIVDLRLLFLNRAACHQLATCAALPQISTGPRTGAGPDAPFIATLGLPGSPPHHAIRCGPWLLDLATREAARPEHGIEPGPLLARLARLVWWP